MSILQVIQARYTECLLNMRQKLRWLFHRLANDVSVLGWFLKIRFVMQAVANAITSNALLNEKIKCSFFNYLNI